MSEFSVILDRVQQGDPEAADKLLPLVYQELRPVAAVMMAGQAHGQTLQFELQLGVYRYEWFDRPAEPSRERTV